MLENILTETNAWPFFEHSYLHAESGTHELNRNSCEQ